MGAHATNRSIALLILLTLAVSGCAASRADPLPSPTSTPRPTVVAVARPELEPIVGRMLAADTLLRQVDSMLSSGYQAQAVELPASASANFKDAGLYLQRARRTFLALGSAGPYQAIADNIGHAIGVYSAAVADSTGHGAQSQREAINAYSFLTRAEAALNATPEAGQPATLADESAALSAVAPPPPARHKPVRHAVPRPTPRRVTTPARHSSVPAATVTSTPTSVPPTPIDTPTPRPTSTPPPPAPTSTPRPVVHHGPSAGILAAIRLLAGQRDRLGDALHRVKACQVKLSSLGAGTDPTGSSAILSCLKHAGREVRDAHVSSGSRIALPATDKRAVGVAHAAASEAATALREARADVKGVDLLSAQNNLAEAATALRRARQALAAVERSAGRLR